MALVNATSIPRLMRLVQSGMLDVSSLVTHCKSRSRTKEQRANQDSVPHGTGGPSVQHVSGGGSTSGVEGNDRHGVISA